MKKHGFTLAEVLITLGIIGVVAALAAPAMINISGNAKVGPTLQKIVSMIEVANEQILEDEGVPNLSGFKGSMSQSTRSITPGTYADILVNYLKGAVLDKNNISTADIKGLYLYSATGRKLTINSTNSTLYFLEAMNSQTGYAENGSFGGKLMDLIIDIDGPNHGKNTFGNDLFYFVVDLNGSIVPIGGSTFVWLQNDDETKSWKATNGEYGCNKDYISDPAIGCAGSIFDNNLKVVYR